MKSRHPLHERLYCYFDFSFVILNDSSERKSIYDRSSLDTQARLSTVTETSIVAEYAVA